MENERLDQLQRIYTELIEQIGEDVSRQGLIETPARAARAIDFLTRGYGESLEEIVNGAIFDSDLQEIVIIKDIELYSMCEHHILPFIGKCHVGYLPNGHVLGLSKVARIVDMYARRLQIQEVLTQQIAEAIQQAIGAAGVGVIIEAQHLCMSMRGVQKQHAMMKTSVLLGDFREQELTRAEFLKLVE